MWHSTIMMMIRIIWTGGLQHKVYFEVFWSIESNVIDRHPSAMRIWVGKIMIWDIFFLGVGSYMPMSWNTSSVGIFKITGSLLHYFTNHNNSKVDWVFWIVIKSVTVYKDMTNPSLHIGLILHNHNPHNIHYVKRPPPMYMSYVSPE